MMKFPHTLILSRRKFIAASAVVLTASATSSTAFASSPLRYCAMTPCVDDLAKYLDMNIRWVESEVIKTVNLPHSHTTEFPKRRTLLTLADENGKNIRRAYVPGLLHTGIFDGNRVLLVTRGNPAYFYALDTDTLEITNYAVPEQNYLFGGHVIAWNVAGQFAITSNIQTEGGYDRIEIYDGKTLKKVSQFNSHGFQAHELALSPDRQLLYVGHYGSNYMSGPYHHLAAEHGKKMRGIKPKIEQMQFYPGSVSIIDIKNAVLKNRLSSVLNGPQGHLAPSSTGQVFLTRIPSLLTPRGGEMTDEFLVAGTDKKIAPHEWYQQNNYVSSGTTVMVDEKHRQYLLANTRDVSMSYGNLSSPQNLFKTNEPAFKEFEKPQGLAFHPDGNHYIASCSNGFMVFKRNTHEFVAQRSFNVRLGQHSHMCLG